MRHTLVARVRHQPGVLSRVAGLFRRRAFNIDTLTVGGSEAPDMARMTIVVDTQRTPAALVAANLRKLVPVVEVTDVTHMPTVDRDLALIRVRCAPGERAEVAGLVDIFRGRVVDVAPGSVIVEVTGDEEKVDGLLELLRPRGVMEMVRTGKVAMVRGTVPVPVNVNVAVNVNGNGNEAAEAQRHRETETE
jgi:acetolactate synthase I/III small subunit